MNKNFTIADLGNQNIFHILIETRKATSFTSHLVNCREINQVTPKCQMDFFDKTCKKRSKTEKVNILIEFYKFQIVWVSNFSLNSQFWVLYQINPKRVFPILKRKKWKSPSNSIYSNKSRFQVSASANNFDFLKQVSKTTILPNENRKNKHHQWIFHIRISLGIKFYFGQKVFNFGTKFAQNKYIRSKTDKVNITIEFCMSELS